MALHHASCQSLLPLHIYLLRHGWILSQLNSGGYSQTPCKSIVSFLLTNWMKASSSHSLFEQDWVHTVYVISPLLSAIYRHKFNAAFTWKTTLHVTWLIKKFSRSVWTQPDVMKREFISNWSKKNLMFPFCLQLQKRKPWLAPNKESSIRQSDSNPVAIFTTKICVFVYINRAFICWFKRKKTSKCPEEQSDLLLRICTIHNKIDKWSTVSDPFKSFKWKIL